MEAPEVIACVANMRSWIESPRDARSGFCEAMEQHNHLERMAVQLRWDWFLCGWTARECAPTL